MEENVGKICPYCNTEIKIGDTVKVCPSCGVPHHEACWNANGGCTTFGCPGQNTVVNPMTVCSACGAPMSVGETFCQHCGASVGSNAAPAADPFAQVPQYPDNQYAQAPQYQQAPYAQAPQYPDNQYAQAPQYQQIPQYQQAPYAQAPQYQQNQYAPAPQAPVKKKSKLPIILGIVGGILLLGVIAGVLITVLGNKKPKVDLNALYKDYCNPIWATVAADGSTLKIDTNPYDLDDKGLAYPAAYEAVKKINKKLGLPDSLLDEIAETRALDGKQTRTFEKQGVSVSWTYHPDRGLELQYKNLDPSK